MALILILLSAVIQLGSSVRHCSLLPVIADFNMYSRYQGEMKWSLPVGPSCPKPSVARYEIQQLCSDSCDLQLVTTWHTPSNDTSVCVDLNLISARECFLRVRAELNNGSYSAYSDCIIVDLNFFMATTVKILYLDHQEGVCVPIVARCNNLGTTTYFYLNGVLTDWPWTPSHEYSVSTINGTGFFCFSSVSETTELLEFCYVNSGCNWCTDSIVILLSRVTLRPRSIREEYSNNPLCPTCTSLAAIASPLQSDSLIFATAMSEISELIYATPSSIQTATFQSLPATISTELNVTTEKSDHDTFKRMPLISAAVVILIVILGVITCIGIAIIVLKIFFKKNVQNYPEGNLTKGPIYDEPILPEPLYAEVHQLPDQIMMSNIETARNIAYGDIPYKCQ